MKIDKQIRKNKYLYSATLLFLMYSIAECLDTVSLLFVVCYIIPNPFTTAGLISIPEVQDIFANQLITMVPFFLGFTVWRTAATIGMFKNRQWGFWLAIGSLLITIILDMWLLPMGAFEILGCIIFLIVLAIGYCGDKPILGDESLAGR
ncbi:MAG: hypothetical protein ACTSU9_11480 [Promethearchaeota archaeon]